MSTMFFNVFVDRMLTNFLRRWFLFFCFKSKLEEDMSTEASPFSIVSKEKLEDIFANKL